MSAYTYTNGRCDTCGCAVEGHHHSAACYDAHSELVNPTHHHAPDPTPDELRGMGLPLTAEAALAVDVALLAAYGPHAPTNFLRRTP